MEDAQDPRRTRGHGEAGTATGPLGSGGQRLWLRVRKAFRRPPVSGLRAPLGRRRAFHHALVRTRLSRPL